MYCLEDGLRLNIVLDWIFVIYKITRDYKDLITDVTTPQIL